MLTYFRRLYSRILRRRSLRFVFVVLCVLTVLLLTVRCVSLLAGNYKDLQLAEQSPYFMEFNFDRWLAGVEMARNFSGQKCIHPVLHPYESGVMQHYRKADPVDCSSAMENWVFVTNGTFRISRRARRLYGKITCEYAPIIRKGDFSASYAPHVKPMLDGTPLPSDFFKVACLAAGGRKYMNIHSGVARNHEVLARLEKHSPRSRPDSQQETAPRHQTIPSSEPPVSASPMGGLHQSPVSASNTKGLNQPKPADSAIPSSAHSLNLSVFIFGFDSLSRMAWIRLLPRTRDYFLRVLGGIEMGGYNILGDGTPAALLPILTGKMEEELPEARRGFPGATTVDDHPWVWKDFSRHGYVTAHGEDMAGVGTFQYRMLGFTEQPTDHHMRTFYLAAEKMYRYNPPLCLGSVPRHVNFMNWFSDLFDMYSNYPKFFFGFHSEMSHDDNNEVQSLDEDLVTFLKTLDLKGHLNSTLLILMSDHGARYHYVRATAQGKLEERLPYFSFRFPPWFQERHPDIVRNMRSNSERLTTPFDIHATFMEILNFSGSGLGDLRHRGISLFKEVPKERTCSHAEVTPHWCACLEWQQVDQSDAAVKKAVQSAIDVINSYTKIKRTQCAELTLHEITRSARYVPNVQDLSAEWKIQKYGQSSSPVNTDSTPRPSAASLLELYQVSFTTEPGGGHFEVTCVRDVISGQFRVNPKEISRINRYGSQPACVQDSMPHLRPYCYCE